MFTVSSSPTDTYFVSLDDTLAELTDLSDQLESLRALYIRDRGQLDDVLKRLNDFVKNSHGATEAPALIEALCEEFGLDTSRRVTATVNVQYTVILDAPYTKTIEEVEEDISGLDYKVDIRYMSDYDFIDGYVEDIDVADIEEE